LGEVVVTLVSVIYKNATDGVLGLFERKNVGANALILKGGET